MPIGNCQLTIGARVAGVARVRMSVVMGTYNGARHVGAQLASLAAQTRLADELLVYDDGSADDTVAVVRRFAALARFPVRVTVNPSNVGAVANFGQAIAAAGGDVILLADQDDVWRPEKLARIEAVFAERPEAGATFSDADVFSTTPEQPLHRLWEAVEFDATMQRQFSRGEGWRALLKWNVITGATLAFRASLRELVLPIPAGWMHDGWIGLLAAATGECVAIPESLIAYRQHPQQQIGGAKLSWREQAERARQMDRDYFVRGAEQCAAAAARLRERAAGRVLPGVLEALAAKAKHLRRRAELPAGWLARLGLVWGERGGYGRYGRGWRAAAQDLWLR